MRRSRCMLLGLLVLGAAGCRQTDDPPDDADDPPDNAPRWELKPPAPDAVPVAAKEKMPGIYPVGTRIKDRDALGGFGPCDNYPKNLTEKDWGTKGAISLVAFPAEPVAYFKHRGIALRVINRTDEAASFAACDSCLFLVREAVDEDDRWRSVETPPEAICGNSFHRVSLKSDQYWEAPARLYSGPIKTKIRFRLDRGDGGPPIYSNEFAGEVAAVQFEERRAK
jgi:hypothetical protein